MSVALKKIFMNSIYFRKESLHLYHYAGNNPLRYTDPTGMMEEEISPIDTFLTSTDAITSFLFAICESVYQGEEYIKAVISEKYNELGITDGAIIGFLPDQGDPFKCKIISETSGKFSKFFLGATIAINAIDVIMVYRKTNGNADAVSKRFVRNTITIGFTLLASKAGAYIGGQFGFLIGSSFGGVGAAPGALIGSAIGGVGSGIFINSFFNNYFKEIGW